MDLLLILSAAMFFALQSSSIVRHKGKTKTEHRTVNIADLPIGTNPTFSKDPNAFSTYYKILIRKE